jgi:diadenylate cyclase
MDLTSGKILGASISAYYLSNIRSVFSPFFLFDVFIVATLFYWVYLFLKETRAMRILYGLFFLVTLLTVGRLLNLMLLNWILKYLLSMLVVAIPVVFQPELRAALEKLGRTKFIKDAVFSRENRVKIVEEIISTTSALSKQRIGALIVIQRQTGLREYIERGRMIDAGVSKDLLCSVFFPKSPLHDGAVMIVNDKIVSACSILPVSEASINPELGTRHKAGLGISEVSDAIAIIVSEETGSVSIAVGGKLERRIAEDRLKFRLLSLLRQKRKESNAQ